MEKGDSLTFIVPDNYRFTNILVYCSLEDTMEITNGGSTVIRTRMYIINTVKFNEETTYKILLKAKNKPYNFQSLFITSNFLVQYEDGEFQTEFSTSYEHFAGALIFVDARDVTNIRVLRFAIQAGYKIGNDYYPCNIFNAGMILILEKYAITIIIKKILKQETHFILMMIISY